MLKQENNRKVKREAAASLFHLKCRQGSPGQNPACDVRLVPGESSWFNSTPWLSLSLYHCRKYLVKSKTKTLFHNTFKYLSFHLRT